MGIGSLPAVFIIEHRRAGQGEVAAAAGEFAKAEAPLRGHAAKRMSVMISSAVSAVVKGPRKKSLACDDPLAGFADSGDPGVAGDGDGRQLGSRIGMRQAAADRAAIANLVMRDVLDGLHQERMRRSQLRIVKDVAPAHHGAKRNAIAVDAIRRSSDTLRRSTSTAGDATRNASIGSSD